MVCEAACVLYASSSLLRARHSHTDEEYDNIINVIRSSNPTISSFFDPSTYTPTLPSKDGTYELMFDLCTAILASRVSNLPPPLHPSNTSQGDEPSSYLRAVCRQLHQDFLLRRTLLLKRLDVTIKGENGLRSMKKPNLSHHLLTTQPSPGPHP